MDAWQVRSPFKHLYLPGPGVVLLRATRDSRALLGRPLAPIMGASGTINFTMNTATRDRPSVIESPEDSLYARVGALLGFKSAVHSEVDLIDRLEKGFPVSTVQTLRARAGL